MGSVFTRKDRVDRVREQAGQKARGRRGFDLDFKCQHGSLSVNGRKKTREGRVTCKWVVRRAGAHESAPQHNVETRGLGRCDGCRGESRSCIARLTCSTLSTLVLS